MKNLIIIISTAFLVFLNVKCTKEFLDKKPDKSLVVPNTLSDLQALLDNGYGVINITTSLTHVADGDFSVNESALNSFGADVRNSYLWKRDIFEGGQSFDWNNMYQQIFYANIVLRAINKIDRESVEREKFDQIKGSALFIRGHALSQIVQQFAAPYERVNADKMLGIPSRTNSDVNIKAKRGRLSENYTQIISDVTESISLLPEITDLKTRPSQVAAYALLARMYLIMGEYKNAADASTSALAIQNEIMDYAELDNNAISPFPDGRRIYNDEVIYYTNRSLSSFYNLNTVTVSKELFEKYDDNDLRKVIFYNSTGGFKGSYAGSPNFLFTGLSTGELYLIRAECYARVGKVIEAMIDLNTLMKKRWKHTDEAEYVPFKVETESEALSVILEERRKELVTRGLRWSDLRRLNLDPRHQVILERTYQGKIIQLLPNDRRYVFPIPQDEIERSGIEQNER